MGLPGNFLQEKCGTQEVKERDEERPAASSPQAEANPLAYSGKDGQGKKGPKDEDVNKSISSNKVKQGKTIDVEKSHKSTDNVRKDGPESHLQDLPPLPFKRESSRDSQENHKPPKPSPQIPSTSGVSGIPHVPRLDLTWLDSGDDQEDSKPPKTTERTGKDSWSSSSSDDSDLDHSDWIVDMLMDGDSSDDEGEFFISTVKKEHTQATVESAEDVKTCSESTGKPKQQNKTEQKATEQTKTPDKAQNSLEESGVKVPGDSAEESHNDSPTPTDVEDRDSEQIDKVSDNKIGEPTNVSNVQESEKEENAGNTDVDTKLATARDIVNGVIEELLNSVVTESEKSAMNSSETSSVESAQAEVLKRESNESLEQTDSTKKNAIEKSLPEVQKVSGERIGSLAQSVSTKTNGIEKSSPEVQKVSGEGIGSSAKTVSTKKNAIEKSSPEVQKVSGERIGSPAQTVSTKKNAIEKSSPEVPKVSGERIGSPAQTVSTKKNPIETSSPELQKVSGERIGSPTQADSTKNSTARSIVGGIIEDVLQVVVTRKKDSGEKDSEESSSGKNTERLQGTDTRTEADSTKPSLVTKADKGKGKSDEELQEKAGNFQPHPPTDGRPSKTGDSVPVTRHSRARQRRRDRSLHPDDVSARTKIADDTNQSGETKGWASADPEQKRTRRLPTLSRDRVRSTGGESDEGAARPMARARRRDSQSAHRQKEQRRSRAGKTEVHTVDKEQDSEVTSNSPPDTEVKPGEKRTKKPPDKKKPKKTRVKSAKQTSKATERVQEKEKEPACEEQKGAGKPLLPKRRPTSGVKHQQSLIKEDELSSDISQKDTSHQLDDSEARADGSMKLPVDSSKTRCVDRGGKVRVQKHNLVDTEVEVRCESNSKGTSRAESSVIEARALAVKEEFYEKIAKLERLLDGVATVRKLHREDIDQFDREDQPEVNDFNGDEKEMNTIPEKEVQRSDQVTGASEQDEVTGRRAQKDGPKTTGEETSEKADTIHPDDQENKATPVPGKEHSDKNEENGGHPPEGEIADGNIDYLHSKTGDSDIKLSRRKKRSRKKELESESSEQESSSDSDVFDPDIYRPKFRASGKLDDPDEYKKLLEDYRELRDTYKLEPYQKGERPMYDLEFTFGEKEYLHYEPPPKTKKSKKGKPKATENRRQSRSDHRESGEGEGHQSRLSRLRSRLSSLARRFVSRVCSCTTIKHLRPKVIH